MNDSLQAMFGIGLYKKNISAVSQGDELFLEYGLKVFPAEKMLEHAFGFFSDRSDPVPDIRKGRAGPVQNFALWIDRLEYPFFKIFKL
jgi:hypothetical protein